MLQILEYIDFLPVSHRRSARTVYSFHYHILMQTLVVRFVYGTTAAAAYLFKHIVCICYFFVYFHKLPH